MMDHDLALGPQFVRSTLILDRSLKNPNLEIDFVRSESELLGHLEGPRLSYQAIFVSADQPGFSAVNAVIALRMRFPLSPIFLFGDSPKPISLPEMKRLGIRDFFTRDELERNLQRKMRRYRQTLPALSRALSIRETRVAEGTVIPEPFQFKGFRPVRAEDLLSEDISLFDVHMLLSTQKMIKIFAANDSFDISRALAYIASGVHWVYVRESGVQQCIQYCKLFSENLMGDLSTDLEMKFLHLVSIAESSLKKTPDSKHSAFELSASFVRLINRDSDVNVLVELLLKHVELLNHSVSVTIAALLLAVQLDIRNPEILSLVGVASLFHDVGLTQFPDHLKTESPKMLSEADMNVYQTHCQKSVLALETAGISELSVLQAVLQHHERRDNSGFPNGIGGGQIHLFAELVGMSDQLVVFLNHKAAGDVANSLRTFRRNSFNQFSLRTIEAFDRVFALDKADIP